ncbi:MAG: MarC family protein [Desulfobacterales bacterium]
MKAFHVSIPALKLAGGLIRLLYALSMVMGGKSKEDNNTHMTASTDIGATA